MWEHSRVPEHLEEALASSNSEMEGLINFFINKTLNSKAEERNKYNDGVVSDLTEFLRKPNDHQPPPPPKKRTKEEEQKTEDPKQVRTVPIALQARPETCPIDVAESALRQRLSQRPNVDAAPYTHKCPENSKNILDQ
ncbi:hypothetical protein T08_15049 [Trichinella sp. T8]|nr:hypothetical protein T08_15049 [Trichinella sp. T8]